MAEEAAEDPLDVLVNAFTLPNAPSALLSSAALALAKLLESEMEMPQSSASGDGAESDGKARAAFSSPVRGFLGGGRLDPPAYSSVSASTDSAFPVPSMQPDAHPTAQTKAERNMSLAAAAPKLSQSGSTEIAMILARFAAKNACRKEDRKLRQARPHHPGLAR